MKLLSNAMLILTLFVTSSVFAQQDDQLTIDSDVLALQHQWAKVNYQLVDDEQEQAFKHLLEQATALTKASPERAEIWVWRGIIESSFAGAKGGLGALSLAKAARESLEKALKLDENALQGSAYTSLGTLYHKMPGWPLGFGDDDLAQELLKKALEINPQGIDPNYFYGEFLFDERKYKQAKEYLIKAQQAPERPSRPLADQSRQQEIAQLLQKVDRKLKRKS